VSNWVGAFVDIYFLSDIVADLVKYPENCGLLNERVMFLPYLSYDDSVVRFNLTSGTTHQYYMNPDGISGYNVLTSPPDSQTFREFITTFEHYQPARVVNIQTDSFEAFCGKWGRCLYESRPQFVCKPKAHHSNWTENEQATYLFCVFALLLFKCLTEACKMAAVVVFFWQPLCLHRSMSKEVLRSSPCGPCLGIIGFDFWHEVLTTPSKHGAIIFRFWYHGVLYQLPLVAVFVYYFVKVQQTGVTEIQILSVGLNLLSIPVLLLLAFRAWWALRERRKDFRELSLHAYSGELEIRNGVLLYAASRPRPPLADFDELPDAPGGTSGSRARAFSEVELPDVDRVDTPQASSVAGE
jgi:hypothetical protein